jgi:arabinose-5-phosphate isomerase
MHGTDPTIPPPMNAQVHSLTRPSTPDPDPGQLIRSGLNVVEIETRAIEALCTRIDGAFVAACRLLLNCQGRVVTIGMGKSGHIARKVAATLASTGTPAFYVHPAEASHGDLGMITDADVVLAMSNSGNTDEILTIVPVLKRMGNPLIAMTGRAGSTLANLADVHLDVSVPEEACPLGLAPTASTTAALVMGDALAVALLEARGFTSEDFARSHPAGALGRRLLLHISDIMHVGDEVPRVPADASLRDALVEMSRKRLGMTAVVDTESRLLGVFTDGDLRRALDSSSDLRGLTVLDAMTRQPKTFGPDKLAVEAARLMEEFKITALVVIDAEQRVVGALNIHDLLRARVV